MRAAWVVVLAAGAAAMSGCTKEISEGPTVRDGTAYYAQPRAKGTIVCEEGRPVVLEGDRSALRLTGPCRHVTVAGRRNDVHVDAAPGGIIEITGARNDVTWRQVGEGPRPELKAIGPNNAFHEDRGS